MNNYFARLVAGLGLVVSALSIPAYSATVVDGGVIHFRVPLSPTPVKSLPRSNSLPCHVQIITVCKRVWSAMKRRLTGK
ncbi:protein YmdA [Enterobacter asburiae]|uniref:Protein YmdA n=1 Tax=Enterobacter asburiae TaxID=61645 RepID=A0A376F4H1_ENTAS|nr:protein YmdA [Enterobacter asburiae]